MGILKIINWVDVVLVIMAVRIIYISIKTGFVIEFIKTLATFLALFIAFHYYIKLTGLVLHWTAFNNESLFPFIEIAVFTGIWLLVLLLIKFARDGLLLVFTVQTISAVDKWGAAAVSLARIVLTASMLMFVFLLSDIPYMEQMTSTSFAKKYVLLVAPDTYQKIIKGFVTKFFPNDKVNPAVTEELREIRRK